MSKAPLELSSHVDRNRLRELELYLVEMQKRGLCDFHQQEYVAPDEQLSTKVMYFQSLALAPSDRRMLARDIIGVPDAQLSPEDKALNASLSYWYGPTYVLTYLTGITDTAKAHIDFDRVHRDPEYVQELRNNISFAKSVGHNMWTSTELHTSIQTEGRNFCRKKYNEPERKASALDIVEWMAALKQEGWVKRVLAAPTLEQAFNEYCSPRGVGPYFGGNSIMMIANIRGLSYTHEEAFCAPGGGCINTMEYLFEPLKKAGYKLNVLQAMRWLWERQDDLFSELTVPPDFHNMDVSYGKIFAKDQLNYTMNSFEVGMCQFSVYRKFKDQPELMKRRQNVEPDLSAFKARERGEEVTLAKKEKTTAAPVKLSLLSFD